MDALKTCAWCTLVHEETKVFYRHFLYTYCTPSNNLLLSLVVQLVPLQLLPDGNGSVDRENASHADALRLLHR